MLPDEAKTKEQLINELAGLRQRVAELEALEAERKRAEEALRENEQRFRRIFEEGPLGMAITSLDYRFVKVNSGLCQMVGYTEQELTALTFPDITHPEHVGTDVQHAQMLINGEIPYYKTEKRYVRKNRESLWIHLSVSVIRGHDGKPLYFLSMMEDITERKQAEEALRESEEKYRGVFNKVPASIILLDKDGQMIDVNPHHITNIGKSKTTIKDYIGQNIITHPNIVNAGLSETYARLLKGEPFDLKDVYFPTTTGGVDSYLNVKGVPLFKEGKVIGAITIYEDITERKRAEELLRESEEQLRLITNALPALVAYVDSEQRYRFNNKAYEKWFGLPLSEVTGKYVKEVMGETAYQLLQKNFEIVLSGQKTTYEGTLPYKDGEERYVTGTYIPHFGEKGEVKGFYVLTQDITERKQAEEALRESEEFRSSLLANSPHPIVVINPDTSVRFVNPALERITGFTSAELIGRRSPYPWWTEEMPQKGTRSLKEGMHRGRKGFERLYQKKNGERFWVEITSRPVSRDGEFKYYLANWVDITERKQAEETLRESEERYRALLNLGGEVGEAIVMLQDTEQGDAIQTFVSDQWPRITGYSRKKLLGMSFLDLLTSKYREAALERHKRRMGGEIIPGLFEMSIIRKDGAEVPIELTSAYTTYKGEQANVAFIRDISERKQAEEREKELQKELSLSSRLASIGELTAGVAHEMNNPLTGILGFSQRLLRKSTDEKISRDLERIHSEALRAAKVVENLLTFARRYESRKQYFNINDILQKALELRAYNLKTNNIEVVTDLASSLPKAMVDFQQLQQVFLNIILNAEQALTEAKRGGKLVIKTQKVRDRIRISFTDDGSGIPEEHLDKLFDPFFTTREAKGGTGLGLSVCHGIVTEHGGTIYAESKPGKGTTFFVKLPLTTEEIDEGEVTNES